MTKEELDLVREVVLETLEFHGKVSGILEPGTKWDVVVSDNPPTVKIIHQPIAKLRQPNSEEWDVLLIAFEWSPIFTEFITRLRIRQPRELQELTGIPLYSDGITRFRAELKKRFLSEKFVVRESGPSRPIAQKQYQILAKD